MENLWMGLFLIPTKSSGTFCLDSLEVQGCFVSTLKTIDSMLKEFSDFFDKEKDFREFLLKKKF